MEGHSDVPTRQPGRPSGSDKRGRAREEAILAATLAVVGELGFERASIDAIASRARASKATIYARWPSKATLVAAALQHQSENGAALDTVDTGSLRGDLVVTLDAVQRALDAANGVSLISLAASLGPHEELRELVRDQIRRTSRTVGAAIAARAVARGEIGPDVDVASLIELAVAHLLYRTLLDGVPPERPECERLVETVLLPLLVS